MQYLQGQLALQDNSKQSCRRAQAAVPALCGGHGLCHTVQVIPLLSSSLLICTQKLTVISHVHTACGAFMHQLTSKAKESHLGTIRDSLASCHMGIWVWGIEVESRCHSPWTAILESSAVRRLWPSVGLGAA